MKEYKEVNEVKNSQLIMMCNQLLKCNCKIEFIVPEPYFGNEYTYKIIYSVEE